MTDDGSKREFLCFSHLKLPEEHLLSPSGSLNDSNDI
jgi:hypothetical protein